MIDANWSRWIFASVTKHFNTNRSSLAMFVEGQLRATAELTDYFELRIDGPTYNEVSRNNVITQIEVNTLVVVKIDEADLHKIYRQVGLVSSIFQNNIPVYKYGDDGSLLGCLSLYYNYPKDQLVVSHFGQIDPDIKEMQACVEGHYRMELRG